MFLIYKINSIVKKKSYLDEAFIDLKSLKFSEKLVIIILDEIEIIRVFTAHPTESTRQTILKKILRLTNLLIDKESIIFSHSAKQGESGADFVRLSRKIV